MIPAKLVSSRGLLDLQSQKFKSILDKRDAFSSVEVGDLEYMKHVLSFILVCRYLFFNHNLGKMFKKVEIRKTIEVY